MTPDGQTDRVHLIDMRQSIERIRAYVAGMDEAAFLRDPKTIAAVEHELAALGEASKNISREAQRRVRGVRWNQWRLVRNTLVHEHYQVNPRTVWRTVTDELPTVWQALEQMR